MPNSNLNWGDIILQLKDNVNYSECLLFCRVAFNSSYSQCRLCDELSLLIGIALNCLKVLLYTATTEGFNI